MGGLEFPRPPPPPPQAAVQHARERERETNKHRVQERKAKLQDCASAHNGYNGCISASAAGWSGDRRAVDASPRGFPSFAGVHIQAEVRVPGFGEPIGTDTCAGTGHTDTGTAHYSRQSAWLGGRLSKAVPGNIAR